MVRSADRKSISRTFEQTLEICRPLGKKSHKLSVNCRQKVSPVKDSTALVS